MSHYIVSHSLKERIVDKIVLLNFETYLPHYCLQRFGDPRFDSFLKDKEDIMKLDKIVENFLNEYPN